VFNAGWLTQPQAAALNELWRGYTEYGFALRPTSWPLTVFRAGRGGQILGIDPSALATSFFAEITGSGSGSGSGSGVDGDRLAYSWVERVEVRAGAWADGPRSGELNAYVAEPRAGWVGVVDAGTVVEMRASPTVSGVYEFLPECCGDGSGSGGQITVITDICLDGVGGGYVRKGIIDIDTRSIIFEWCEPIGACGSGSGGGLCPDVPSGSGSGSGSGGTGEFGCCPGESAATLTATISGGEGSTTLSWDGSAYWQGSKALTCGSTLHLRYSAATCAMGYCCDGVSWLPCPASIGTPTCAPFDDPRTFTCDMMDTLGGCPDGGACGSFTVTVAT